MTPAGMPHPQNLEMARQVEADVRAGGAVPATIGLLDGEVIVRAAQGAAPGCASSGGMEPAPMFTV